MINSKTAVMVQTHHNLSYIYELAKTFTSVNFIVHFDGKVKNLSFDQIKLPNLHFLDERVDVYWGGYSQVRATLALLEYTIENTQAEYIHLISGDCYPLVSFSEIETEWDNNPHANYIESHLRRDNAWRLKTWLPHADSLHMRTFFGRVLKRMLRLLSKIINTSGIYSEPFFGSQWFSIKRELAIKIISIHKSTEYFSRFSKITCADEHVFSIFVREHNVSNIEDNNRRYIHFQPGTSSPDYLILDDILNENASLKNKYWFARKIHEHSMLEKLKDYRHD